MRRGRRYPRCVLTVFTVPKPFRGRVGEIQRNAIESWCALRHDVQVVLVGDEDGVARAAREAGVEHVGGLLHNDRGTPRLDSAFARAATVARLPLWCFVNSDILLLDDALPAFERVASAFDTFLVIGECRDLDVAAGTATGDVTVRAGLRESALERGRLRGYAALDYFVFPRGLFDPVPPFAIGRAGFDNWLVWRARAGGHPVVDATRRIVAVHQSHDYLHVPGGQEEAYSGAEAERNIRLAGGKEHIYSLHDATHRLLARGRPIPYLGSTFRARERARRAKWRIDARAEARRHRKGFERPVRLLGIFSHPRVETTPTLDELDATAGAELVVLYSSRDEGTSGISALRHDHWFPRSVRLSGLDRILGRSYAINWAIWRSLRRLRPDCVIVEGWSTFAAHAAIAWCVMHRIPYLLVVELHAWPGDASRAGHARQLLVRAVVRQADAVVVWDATITDPDSVDQGRSARVRVLPRAADVAASRVLQLARSAWGADASPRARRRARGSRFAATRGQGLS